MLHPKRGTNLESPLLFIRCFFCLVARAARFAFSIPRLEVWAYLFAFERFLLAERLSLPERFVSHLLTSALREQKEIGVSIPQASNTSQLLRP
jgi:hypothetical protein